LSGWTLAWSIEARPAARRKPAIALSGAPTRGPFFSSTRSGERAGTPWTVSASRRGVAKAPQNDGRVEGCLPFRSRYRHGVTATQKLALVVVLWILIGVIASVVMGRRGHASFTWLLLGALLGPLVIPVGLSADRSARRPDPRLQVRRLREGGSGAGPVDVLVGIDGSDRSIEALRAAVGLFSEGIGRLTLAGVIDFDSARASRTGETNRLQPRTWNARRRSSRSCRPRS